VKNHPIISFQLLQCQLVHPLPPAVHLQVISDYRSQAGPVIWPISSVPTSDMKSSRNCFARSSVGNCASSSHWARSGVSSGRIELQDFLVLEVQRIDRGEQRGMLSSGQPRRVIHRLMVRPSKKLKALMNR
jgi:hypothetical protein